jgi:type III restriction enzyme
VKPDRAASAAVWEAFEALYPKPVHSEEQKPAKRWTVLAHELASDDILGCWKVAHAEMLKALVTARPVALRGFWLYYR